MRVALSLAAGLLFMLGNVAAAEPLRIVLDPGHTDAQGGALGARGVYEVRYNDTLARQVQDALRAEGFDVRMTRSPGQSIGLTERAQRANDAHAALFLSIHHDSAQPKYLEKTSVGAQLAYRTIQPMGGYSIFVSQLNPQFDRASTFARMLGDEMLKLGRAPALHHAEPIAGENRELLDRARGIYRFDDLVVLKKTDMPAVLLEVGVIVDADDEAYVSAPENQARITQAIVAAVKRYAAAPR
ncbi:N-acetylmuramoyl-L-alanine amidase [Uliginosibacterium sp. sgz301328]|uniref:N-acetylmuramoyl-L-alanine amidase family protein n=1 Tax=Uliginosibacterium sp. sgz301328 TaxID=3243764 RepID=UPI00359CF7E7